MTVNARLFRLGCCIAVWAVGASVTGCDCSTTLISTGHTVLTITSPVANAAYQTGESFDYHATANNNLGVASIQLHAGGANGVADQLLTTCDAPSGTTTTLACDMNFEITEHASLIGAGEIHLTAIAFDEHKIQTTVAENVRISPIICSFTAPPITDTTATPPYAAVGSMSDLIVSVTSALPVASVAVTYDSDEALTSWTSPAPPSTPPLLLKDTTVDWPSKPGAGMHLLTATCKDTMGDTDTATLEVSVGCTVNADCSSGTRCCATDATCYPTVGVGDDCSCQKPCSVQDACVPGTCGSTPATCQPGCFPGSAAQDEEASMCASENGVPAYCNALPSSLATPQNQGGACTVGDTCTVDATTSCADAPVDRTMPVSSSNPNVAQTCTPVAPTVFACIPAGNIALWGTGCTETCGPTVSSNCAQGSVCVQRQSDQGTLIGPSECRQQCEHPGEDPSPDCPSDRPACVGSITLAGMVQYSTGVCTEPPCSTDSDCAAFTSTPCCDGNNICSVMANGSCM